MTQIDTTTEAGFPLVEPTDFLPYLARSIARELHVLDLATADGVQETITVVAENAAVGMDSLIGALMQTEGLAVEEALARAAALIAEQGQAVTGEVIP